MGKQKSFETRNIVLHVYHYHRSLRLASKVTGIPKSTIQRWEKCPSKERASKRKLIESPIIEIVKYFSLNKPYFVLDDIKSQLYADMKIDCSIELIRSVMRKNMNLAYKKTKLAYYTNKQKLETETKNFVIDFKKLFLKKPLVVSFDEVGFSSRLQPLYKWSKKGKSDRVITPMITKNKQNQNKSVCACITSEGTLDYEIQEKAFRTETFFKFFSSFDFPTGTIVLIDNVSFHRSKNVKIHANEKGWNLLYTPPYSPWFNPIENI